MEQITKAILVCVTFFTFFFCLGAYDYLNYGSVSASSDFGFHWETIHDLSLHSDYPKLYHWLFSDFSYLGIMNNPLAFYSINLLLICLAIPLVICWATKTWWSSILYFAGVSIPHLLIYGATYPEALALLCVVCYLCCRKNWLVFLICAVFASLTHREGIFLFGLIFVAELIDFLLKKRFEGWANQVKQVVKKPYLAGAVLPVQKFFDAPHYLFYLITQISAPVWFYAKGIFVQPFWLVLAVVPLIVLNYDARIISVTSLALLFVASPEISKSKHKIIISLFLLAQLLFFILEFSFGTMHLLSNN